MAFPIGLLFLLKLKITLFYFLSFVCIRFITHLHSLPLIVIFCYSLSFVVICCHFLYHSLSLFSHSLYHSLSFVVPLDIIRRHLFSLVVPLVVIRCHSLSFDVTRCTTRLSFYKRSFYIFLLFISFITKTKT